MCDKCILNESSLKGSLLVNQEKEIKEAMIGTKKRGWENKVRKKSFIDYKKIEALKFDLLRLESRRAQLKLIDDEKKLALIERKIYSKREKLYHYFLKYSANEESQGEL